MDTAPDFLLVIPAYEEHRRLPPFLRDLVEQLGCASHSTRIQIVDDGSSAASARELERALGGIKNSISVQVLPLLRLEARRGKGCAIRTGWNSAVRAKWLAFVDADGAIPAGEVSRILGDVSRRPPANEAHIAVRAADQGRQVRRSGLRERTGRWFVRFVHLAFRCSFRDPQCGFKIIASSAWEKLRERSLENGFCFDPELLLLLKHHQIPIGEMPVDWQEKSGGHFRLLPDGMRTLLSAGFLWWRVNFQGL